MRELAEAIQAYLDGDRDLERRRELAKDHARRAELALIEQAGDPSRARAMREAGRAIVLDPENATAKDVLMTLMLGAPSVIPAAALAAADDERMRSRQDVIRFGARAYLGLAITTSVLFALPLHHVWPVVVAVVLASGTALAMYLIGRRPLPIQDPLFLVMLIVSCILLTTPGLIFGSLLVMPMFLVGSLGAWLSQPSGTRSWLVVAIHVAAFGLVFALELGGVLPRTFRIQDSSLVLSPWVMDLTPLSTAFVLVVSITAQVINTSVTTLTSRRVQEQAQNAIHAQRWHLQQVLPQPPVAPVAVAGSSDGARCGSATSGERSP